MSEHPPETGTYAEDADVLENASDGSDGAGQIGLETPDDDAREQHTPAGEDLPVGVPASRASAAFDMKEVNEADAADQERAVDFDEDDYR